MFFLYSTEGWQDSGNVYKQTPKIKIKQKLQIFINLINLECNND